jgi:serine protease AprX
MTRVRRKAVWGAALAFWLWVPTPAVAQYVKNKTDKPLSESPLVGTQQVIIRVKPGAKPGVRRKLERTGGGVVAEHKLVEAVTAKINARQLADLLNDPDVASVSVDALVHASGGPGSGKKDRSSTTGSSESGDDTVTSTAYSGLLELGSTVTTLKETLGLAGIFSGSSVTVAVIDSGLAPLTDFQGRISGFYDFTYGRNGLSVTPYDDYGHGTHVAGLIGSSGATSFKRYAGVAPAVKFLPLKVLDRKGAGRTSDVIRALEFAVANKDRFGIRVVNVSLGHPIYESAATDPLVQAVESAVRAGLVVVVAAGNCGINPTTGLAGYGGIASPGNAPSAITVGAADTKGTISRADDRVAPYSSRGPAWFDGTAKPDLLAPGQAMISNEVSGSTLAVDYPSLLVKSGTSTYLKLNGSSMATGVVAGLAALMIEANQWGAYSRWSAYQESLHRNQRTSWTAPPVLTANAIKAMLQYSATAVRDANGVPYDALTQGTGLVNGVAAVTLAYYADTTRSAGSFWLTTDVPAQTTFGGVVEPWTQALIWGTRVMTGSSIVEVNQMAWDDNIVWGTGEYDNIVWGTLSEDDNIVWGTSVAGLNVSWLGNVSLGDNIVWGTAEWADNIVWGTGLIGYFDGDNIVWGTLDADNIVWGTLSDDNIVWGTNDNKVTILGSSLIGGGL